MMCFAFPIKNGDHSRNQWSFVYLANESIALRANDFHLAFFGQFCTSSYIFQCDVRPLTSKNLRKWGKALWPAFSAQVNLELKQSTLFRDMVSGMGKIYRPVRGGCVRSGNIPIVTFKVNFIRWFQILRIWLIASSNIAALSLFKEPYNSQSVANAPKLTPTSIALQTYDQSWRAAAI